MLMQIYKQLLVTGLCVALLSANVLYAAAKPITATDSAEQAERATQQQELTNYFFAAARIGQTEVLREFLQAGFPVNVRNAQSYTALMTATYYGQKEAVDLLLAHGADACLRDKREHSALMGAMVKAEWGIARTLYRINCEQQTGQPDIKTVEEFAAMFGQSEKLEELKQELQPPRS